VAIAIVITKVTGEVEACGRFSSHWGAPRPRCRLGRATSKRCVPDANCLAPARVGWFTGCTHPGVIKADSPTVGSQVVDRRLLCSPSDAGASNVASLGCGTEDRAYPVRELPPGTSGAGGQVSHRSGPTNVFGQEGWGRGSAGPEVPSVSADAVKDEYRAGGLVCDRVRDASQDSPLARHALVSDNDQVGVEFLRCFHEVISR